MAELLSSDSEISTSGDEVFLPTRGGGGGGRGDKGKGRNDPPVALADTATAVEDGPVVNGSVATNDSDPDGDTLTYSLSAPVDGLTLNSDGTYSFDPSHAAYQGLAAGEIIDVVATYFVSDGREVASSTLTITLTGTNDLPVASTDNYSTDEDSALLVVGPGVLGNDSDIDGDALSAVLVAGPAHGTLALNADGSFTYTPSANYNGADSFTYTANDGTADGNTVTVSLTVNPVNDAPVAAADAYATDEDTQLIVAGAGVLANDSDIDGDTLSAILVDDVDNGTLTLNADGSFSYTPDANYTGADSFTYKINDGTTDGNTVTVALTVSSVNDAPVAVSDSYATDEDAALVVPATGVLANDTDVEGDALSAVLVSGVSNGTLTLSADGSFTYTPDANYSGTDSFSYKPGDGNADGNVVVVNLTVNPINDAPTSTNLNGDVASFLRIPRFARVQLGSPK